MDDSVRVTAFAFHSNIQLLGRFLDLNKNPAHKTL